MSKPLVIDGVTYNYPENRDPPGWGEDASNWAEAVTITVQSFAGPGDILPSIATINNDTSLHSVNGLFFDAVISRSAVAEYAIVRTTNTVEKVESGTLYLTYKPISLSWDIVQVGGVDAEVTLQITSGGQVQYTCASVITGTGYSGTIRFRARTFGV